MHDVIGEHVDEPNCADLGGLMSTTRVNPVQVVDIMLYCCTDNLQFVHVKKCGYLMVATWFKHSSLRC